MRKKDDEKEKNIKAAVIKLILHEGFHGTSISKIAKEAGVSPATLYIYFDSKEMMLRDIYQDYAEEIYHYMINSIHHGMNGKQLIEILMRSYYEYIQENEEIFNFVEQFSHCPSLSCGCAGIQGIFDINHLVSELKANEVIRDYYNENILSIIFYPVKSIVVDHDKSRSEQDELLEEMIRIIQNTLLR
ncbi:TetR/AcrR family transcriptional regulator [Acetobacterium woodii]|uniref:Transcriptional regulator TetR family n=1 Tax=Acetobacterium woodii (strain ATCC 29683 / DSM 1030 / JCM 2381 / KCTC 1655 / WB1) TaxID=931626 RepID=H6LGM1_ACEWD|nr:TetR/AcrR family transcriptional regulator [Acetobacterium woodii]AFA48349.1 transcriptional regulator TetR family [Acetobacterium woodii DSM 1030]